MTLLRYVIAATALTLTNLPVHADIMSPGGAAGTPSALADPGNVPILGTYQSGFNLSLGGKTLVGTVNEYVFVDPFTTHLIPSCLGCLDFAFVIAIDPSSTGSLFTFGFGDIRGLITNVDYVTESGGIAPNFDNRLGPGFAVDAVGWGFTGFVTAGETTDALLVATNATSFNNLGLIS